MGSPPSSGVVPSAAAAFFSFFAFVFSARFASFAFWRSRRSKSKLGFLAKGVFRSLAGPNHGRSGEMVGAAAEEVGVSAGCRLFKLPTARGVNPRRRRAIPV